MFLVTRLMADGVAAGSLLAAALAWRGRRDAGHAAAPLSPRRRGSP